MSDNAEAQADGHEPDDPKPLMAHGSVLILGIPNGKVGMWLFLGSEVMFFTGLIGAYIVKHYGNERCFQVDGLTFLFSAVFILFIVTPSRSRAESATPSTGRILDGFTYCRTHRRVVELIVFTVLFWSAASAVRSTIPALVKGGVGGGLDDIANFNAVKPV